MRRLFEFDSNFVRVKVVSVLKESTCNASLMDENNSIIDKVFESMAPHNLQSLTDEEQN